MVPSKSDRKVDLSLTLSGDRLEKRDFVLKQTAASGNRRRFYERDNPPKCQIISPGKTAFQDNLIQLTESRINCRLVLDLRSTSVSH